MKQLSDNDNIPMYIFGYLALWNKADGGKYIKRMFGKEVVRNLTLPEFKMLFLYATSEDYKNL